MVPLVVQRAQGTLGDVRAEWRTKDITALSEGKSPPDYVVSVSVSLTLYSFLSMGCLCFM